MGSQLAQSCHVCFSFAEEHKEISSQWQKDSNYICILNASSEAQLIDLMLAAQRQNIALSIFREPDMDNQITALALAPCVKAKKLCGRLPLACRDKPNE